MVSRYKKYLFRIVIIALIVFMTMVTVSYHAGTLLTSPAHSKIGPPPSGFQLQNVAFESKDDLLIRGWYGPGEKNKGALVLFHGIRSNRRQMLNRARYFNDQGLTVLLVDLQAHGESDGDRITFGYNEAGSAHAALDYLRKRIPDEKIAVIGVSLGGAACLLGDSPLSADAIVIEEVYATVEEAIVNRLTLRLGWLGRFVAPLLVTLAFKPLF